MNKKGQGMAIDLIAAVLIFIVIGGSIMFVWENKKFEVEESLFENEIIAMAERTLDTMIKSKGLPTNWENGNALNIQMLGLAKRNMILDTKKVEKFAELSNSQEDYAILRTKLLIGGNNYYFRVFEPEKEKYASGGTIISAGEKPEGNVVEVRIRRPINYTYHKEGIDEVGEKNQHGAIAEIILYSEYWRR